MEQKLMAHGGGFAGGSGGGGQSKWKTIYMFLGHSPGNGCAHTLYALPIPNNEDQQQQPWRPPPVLTFMEDEYPTGMLCVKLDSKLYFIGGAKSVDNRPTPSRETYILDLGKPLPLPGTPPPQTSIFLDRGPRMTTGKMHPLAFAAVGKIFVLSIKAFPRLMACEVFTPGRSNGGCAGGWAELPPPPFKTFLKGHVVVKDEAFISCENGDVHTFDLRSFEWKKVIGTPPFTPMEVSLFLDNKLYLWYFRPYNVYFETLKFSQETKEVEACEDWKTLDLGVHRVRTWCPSACLAHDDERGRLCFLEVGCSPHPDYENNQFRCHPEQCVVKLHVFDSKSGWFLNGSVFIVSSQKTVTHALSAFVA